MLVIFFNSMYAHLDQANISLWLSAFVVCLFFACFLLLFFECVCVWGGGGEGGHLQSARNRSS